MTHLRRLLGVLDEAQTAISGIRHRMIELTGHDRIGDPIRERLACTLTEAISSAAHTLIGLRYQGLLAFSAAL